MRRLRGRSNGGVHRGAGQVDAHKVDKDEGKADGESCKVAGADFAVGRAEDDEDEDEGRDDFHEEGAAEASGVSHAVGAEGTGQVRGCDDLGQEEEHRAGDDAAEDLADPVAAGVLPAHAAGDRDGEGNGRVDVASADAADGVGHGDDGEAESDCGADDTCRGCAAEEHGSPAAQKRQDEGPDALSDVLFHMEHWFRVVSVKTSFSCSNIGKILYL